MSDAGADDRDPYRTGTLALAPSPARIAKPSSRAFALRVVGWAALSLGMFAVPGAVAGAMCSTVIITGMLAEFGLSTRWYRRARRVVEAMPFPIVHVASGRPIKLKSSGRSIEWVRVALASKVETSDLPGIVHAAQQALPFMQIVIDSSDVRDRDHLLTLHGWPHRDDDILVLVKLLGTWGLEVHAAHGVTSVTVSWRAIPRSG